MLKQSLSSNWILCALLIEYVIQIKTDKIIFCEQRIIQMKHSDSENLNG